jgi:TonB family protein
MTFRLLPKFNIGYLLSIVVHAVLLLIMALLAIHPAIQVKWHSFEWSQEQPQKLEIPASSKGDTQRSASQEIKAVAPVAAVSQSIEQPITKGETNSVLEQPKIADTSIIEPNRSASRVVRNLGKNALRSIGENLPGGDYGFSGSLEQGGGEAYIISQPKPAIIPSEEGEVYLEFKLDQAGRVDMSSVNIISYSTASYADAVQKALRSWKFGFKGRYEPNRIYRIRCKFVIDERE